MVLPDVMDTSTMTLGGTLSALLEMPVSYTTVADDEFDDLEGGAVPVLAIIAAAIGSLGALYAAGTYAAQRCYYAGLRNPEYQQVKWNVRGGVLGIAGIAAGGAVLLGFENQFYSMI